MTPNEPILTFAIPTFNRLACLRLLIESIVDEVQASNGGIELLVCDNASSDGSTEWLRAMAGRGTLRLLEQGRNEGADINTLTCLLQARGRHVWICGDDDLPLQGALTRVAGFVSERRPRLLYLPARWHHGDLGGLPRESVPALAPQPIGAMELAVRSNAFVTFISSWVVDKSAYFEAVGAGHADRYVGTSLVQLEWHLTHLAQGDGLYAAKAPWLIARAGNTGGYSLFDTFVARYHRILGEKLAGTPSLRDFLQEHLLRGYLPGLVWGLRIGALGRFEPVDWGKVEQMMAATWPQRPGPRGWISRIARWPRPLAKLAMGHCWLDARVWAGRVASGARGAA